MVETISAHASRCDAAKGTLPGVKRAHRSGDHLIFIVDQDTEISREPYLGTHAPDLRGIDDKNVVTDDILRLLRDDDRWDS